MDYGAQKMAYAQGNSIGSAGTTAVPSSHRDASTIGGAMLSRLEQADQLLSHLIERQKSFVLRVLPPEPVPEKQCDPRVAQINANLTHDLDAVLGRIAERLNDLSYWTDRMDRIA